MGASIANLAGALPPTSKVGYLGSNEHGPGLVLAEGDHIRFGWPWRVRALGRPLDIVARKRRGAAGEAVCGVRSDRAEGHERDEERGQDGTTTDGRTLHGVTLQ